MTSTQTHRTADSATGKKGTKRRHDTKTFGVKYQAIMEVEKGHKSKAAIAKLFEIPATTLSSWIKSSESIKEAYLKYGPNRKTQKTATYEDLETATLKWFSCARDQNIPISGPILSAKAEEFASQLDCKDFKASTGWLERFKDRHGITFKKVCGEANSVKDNTTEMEEWNNRLRLILEKYSADDIYNADETGIFYRLLPDKTLEFKSVACHGGKKSKERITALVCSNMTGKDKLPLLIIGKSARPRCFKNKKTLPTAYTSNRKAWMTSEIFTDWLKKLDSRLQRQKRQIAMIIDNCPAHPNVRHLKSIELVFLPPNTTSKTQPMDQGVIHNLKTHYRKKIILRQMAAIDTKTDFSLTILDAMRLLKQAWDNVEPRTIQNCFRHANFSHIQPTDTLDPLPEDEDPEDDIPLARLSQLGITMTTFQDYASVDDDIPTSEILTDSNIVQEIVNNRTSSTYDDDDDTEEIPCPELISLNEAMNCYTKLRDYFEQCDNSESFSSGLDKISDFLLKQDFQRQCAKQTVITGFFKPRDSN